MLIASWLVGEFASRQATASTAMAASPAMMDVFIKSGILFWVRKWDTREAIDPHKGLLDSSYHLEWYQLGAALAELRRLR